MSRVDKNPYSYKNSRKRLRRRAKIGPIDSSQFGIIAEHLSNEPAGIVRFTDKEGHQLVAYNNKKTGLITVKAL